MSAPLIDKILSSRKYADVDRATVERILEQESRKYKKEADVEKAARRMLHIICRSFSEPESCDRAMALLSAYEGGARELLLDKAFSRSVMELHASTRERLPCIDAFYAAIMPHLGKTDSVLDIGCGFHPFALPWMEFTSDIRYHAFDIGNRNAALLRAYFSAIDNPNAVAFIRDALGGMPEERYSSAFLLKLLPVLEQQRKGAAREILENVPAQSLIVSFPTKSLTGKSKGMEAHYSDFLEKNLPDGMDIAFRAVIGNELAYILKRS